MKQVTQLEIAYPVWAAYDVHHFGPVCRELNRRGANAYFVLQREATWYRGANKRKEKLEHFARMRDLLEAQNLPCVTTGNPAADVALTTQGADRLKRYRNTKLKAPYGTPSVREDGHLKWEQNEGFDGILVHGQLQKQAHQRHVDPARVRIIGIPKYDAFFQHPPAQQAVRQRYQIPDGKPIVTYLPTWGAPNCTIHTFYSALESIAATCTLVIKPHPHTQKNNFKTGEIEKLRRLTPFVMDACGPTEDAVVVADLLITDVKSGTSTESMYLTRGKTPWIGVTPHPKNAFFDVIAAAGPIIRNPADLPAAISQQLQRDDYQQQRRELIEYAYEQNYGRAAEDAADAIIQLAELEIISRGVPLKWNKLKRSARRHTHNFRQKLESRRRAA